MRYYWRSKSNMLRQTASNLSRYLNTTTQFWVAPNRYLNTITQFCSTLVQTNGQQHDFFTYRLRESDG